MAFACECSRTGLGTDGPEVQAAACRLVRVLSALSKIRSPRSLAVVIRIAMFSPSSSTSPRVCDSVLPCLLADVFCFGDWNT